MNQERLMQIIVAPHITEKAYRLADGNVKQITFKVLPDSTKPEIKHAVEYLFKVEVKDVRVVNCKGKKKRFGRIEGQRKDWKKAYVSLKPGFDIKFSVE